MNISYATQRQLAPEFNQELIAYLDIILNHHVDDRIWQWEFNSLPNTIFSIATADGKIIGTQSMLPIKLNVEGTIIETAKSETSYLDPGFRGKKIFEQLYELALSDTIANGTAIIWGFTPAIKAWKKNLGFYVNEEAMNISVINAGKYRFGKQPSRNIVYAIGKFILNNYRYYTALKKLKKLTSVKMDLLVSTSLRNNSDLNHLFSTLRKCDRELIHLDLSETYRSWRLDNNPLIGYEQVFFYNDEELVGYLIYSIKDGIMRIADLTFNLQNDVLYHIFKYIFDSQKDFFALEYWGNQFCIINKSVFDFLQQLGGTKVNDPTRNFVCRYVAGAKTDQNLIAIKNWYITGLWTEGFHI